jgi:predicted ester cyclase
MSVEENKEIVRRFNEEAWNKGNMGVIDELVAPECLLAGITQPEFKAWITSVRQGTPDYQIHIDELLAEGDRVMMRWTTSGTPQQSAQGGPLVDTWPPGKPFNFSGVSAYTVRGGKVVSDWAVTNYTEMLVKAGGSPTPSQSSS